jgi:hypothetical protein
MKEGEKKKGNGYRTDKYSMSLDSLVFKTTNVALELIKYFLKIFIQLIFFSKIIKT